MNRNPSEISLITQYIMETRFATLLSEIRRQQEVTLEQLSDGLCAVSQLAKIEKAERIPGRMMQKRLLERLGLDVASFENFLQPEDYEEWKEQEDILYYIEAEELETAKDLLKQYAKSMK